VHASHANDAISTRATHCPRLGLTNLEPNEARHRHAGLIE
jgi:hypothetical protein